MEPMYTSFFPRQRWTYPKDNERNFVAAFFHVISISLIGASLIWFGWFKIQGGAHCTPYISLNQFFTIGYFDMRTGEPTIGYPGGVRSSPVTIQYHSNNKVLSCVTPEVVSLIRTVILLCLMAIFSSIVGFCLDVIGPKKKLLRVIRRNGLPSIVAVLLIVIAAGLCYLVISALEIAVYEAYPQAVVQITYEHGYFTLAIAGAVSLLATACNILQPSSPPEDILGQRLVEEPDGLETFSVHPMRSIPEPPPPYTP